MPSGVQSRVIVMLALIVSGEAIFVLPFVLPRVFRPTLLDVFGLSNLQLGTMYSFYGIVAMASYFLGGPLADRFSARRLMAAALVATAAGGAVCATIPPAGTLGVLYAFWGATTVLLFWATMIRATREFGGPARQGRAYGILDSGRGLTAALLASVTLVLFAFLLPDPAEATLQQRSDALSKVIWVGVGLTFGAAGLVWSALPEARRTTRGGRAKLTLNGLRAVVRLKTVWLQAVIIVCAYVAYRSTDNFSLFARDALGYDDVAAAQIGTLSLWMRSIAPVAAGLLGDRIGVARAVSLTFALSVAGNVAIAWGVLSPGVPWNAFVAVIAGAGVATFALRGLYFALFEEARVPVAFTGSAVGLVSVIGYTPDVFAGPMMGYLLDRSPGALGHQHVFAVVAAFATAGLVAALLFERESRKPAPRRTGGARAEHP